MKRQLIKSGTIIATIAIMVFSSCQKEQVSPGSDSGQPSGLATFAVSESRNALAALSNLSNSYKDDPTIPDLSGGVSGSCAAVTNDTISQPHIYTIDYGATGCVCSDGKIRKGKMVMKYTSTDIRAVNNLIAQTYTNYFVNSDEVNGTVTTTNKGFRRSGNLYYTIIIKFQALSSVNTTNYTASIEDEWIGGESTQTTSDDVYSMTGSESGKHNGFSFTITETSPLIFSVGCGHYIQGTVVDKQTGQYAQFDDYSSGYPCTGLMTRTVNGVTRIIAQHQTPL